jgi:hypothetical protein
LASYTLAFALQLRKKHGKIFNMKAAASSQILAKDHETARGISDLID